MAEMNSADPSRGLRGTLAAEYLLGSDVDLSEYAAAYHNQGWRPIGTVERDTIYRFTGTFDGGGHTISNMTQALDSSVQMAKYSGLFGYAERASIKNLTLRAIRSAPAISGSVSVGGLAGGLLLLLAPPFRTSPTRATKCFRTGKRKPRTYRMRGFLFSNP